MDTHLNSMRRALEHTPINSLPLEVQTQIEGAVPAFHNAENAARLKARHPGAIQSPPLCRQEGNPNISPATGTPFLTRLPPEIRRLIFLDYLLPDKSNTIKPKVYEQCLASIQSKQRGIEDSMRRARADRQRIQQAAWQSNAHWAAMLVTPLPVYTPLPGQNLASQGPPQNAAGHQASQHLHPVTSLIASTLNQIPSAPPQTANPLNGWTTSQPQAPPNPTPFLAFGGLNHSLPTATTSNNTNIGHTSLSLPGAPSSHVAQLGVAHPRSTGSGPVHVPTLGGHVFHNFIALPNGQILQSASPQALPTTNSPLSPTTIHTEDTESNDDNEAKEVWKAVNDTRALDKYDSTPENLITKLLTTNIKLCLEVSTILYEEYTFEVHIHASGVDFLHLDRIPTLETWGAELENTLGMFKERGHFNFNRMKHIEFVFFAGPPEDRIAGLRMRESLRKLIGFLSDQKDPLASIKVRFDYDRIDRDKAWGLENAFADGAGTFWSSKRASSDVRSMTAVLYEPRASIFHEVYNVQLVTSPLKNLRRVHNVGIEFPAEIRGNKKLVEYAVEVMNIARSEDMTAAAQDELMREEMIMDARRDKELELAGAGGYYKQKTSVADPGVTSLGRLTTPNFMLDEDEVEEGDGLIAALHVEKDSVYSITHAGRGYLTMPRHISAKTLASGTGLRASKTRRSKRRMKI